MSPATAGKPSRTDAPVALDAGELAILAEKAPELARSLVRVSERLASAELRAYVIGHLTALAALSILAVLSWHYVDKGAATQGAAIICTGAVSIIAVFVTGRLTSERPRSRSRHGQGST